MVLFSSSGQLMGSRRSSLMSSTQWGEIVGKILVVF